MGGPDDHHMPTVQSNLVPCRNEVLVRVLVTGAGNVSKNIHKQFEIRFLHIENGPAF